jgi:predicted alpha/beta hydrolase
MILSPTTVAAADQARNRGGPGYTQADGASPVGIPLFDANHCQDNQIRICCSQRPFQLGVIDVAETVLDDVFIDDISFPATDGYLLGASLYLPRDARRHAVLISSATAVPRKIYKGFASYLAGRGCAVLTYDYRGIGDSRLKSPIRHDQQRSLVGFDASMSEWAARDVTAAVAWMRERYQTLPLSYVGHSFGGQALGLIPNNSEVARALLIAAQAAYWRLMASPERYHVYVLMNFVGIPLTRLLGYAPGWSGIGEDLPQGVYLQWVRWVMSRRYMFDDPKLPALANFANYRGALRALYLSDDPWATRPAIELLCSGFSATTPDIVTLTPADAGAAKIGHFGFFRSQHRGSLWRSAAEWLLTA